MGTGLENIATAFMAADENRRDAALRVLKGEAGTADGREGKGDIEPFLTLREVARRTGISTCSLWRYSIPSHDFAGRPRYRLSEVQAHLARMAAARKKGGRKTAKQR